MTLSQFLDVTADTPEDQIRLALTRALAAGAPHSREDYSRLYQRVLIELRCDHANLSAVA